jgi:hypothetical protein
MNTSTDTPKASDPREDGRTNDVLGQWQRFVRGQPLQAARQSDPAAQVVVITGYRAEMECAVQQVLAEGASGVLRKPFDVPLLLETLKGLVRGGIDSLGRPEES